MWPKLLKKLKVEPKQFIAVCRQRILKLLIEEFVLRGNVKNALATVVNISPDVILPAMIQLTTKRLKEISKTHVTRDEYFTYLTPEGELYDKSVITG